MTLPRFLDASLALWTEENLRMQPLKDFSSLLDQVMPSNAKVEIPIPKPEVKAQNDEAVAALRGMMSTVRKRK